MEGWCRRRDVVAVEGGEGSIVVGEAKNEFEADEGEFESKVEVTTDPVRTKEVQWSRGPGTGYDKC